MTVRYQMMEVLLITFTLISCGSAFVPVERSRGFSPTQKIGRRISNVLSERVWDTHAPDPGKESLVTGANGTPRVDEASVGEATLRLGLMSSPTVWTEFSRIGQENEVVNLGQGFPDWLPPKFAIDSLVEAVLDSAQSPHQYTRSAGHPNLVNQLATRYSTHMRREIDPFTEIAVTVGASQALYLSLQTLVQPGDEVLMFEPFFDLYVNQVKLAGGTPIFVPLTFVPYEENEDVITGGDWILEPEALNKVVNTRTKAIILNSPHNPTGKIFTRGEMEHVAAALELAHPDCVVLSDEVYKYIVHSPPKESVSEDSLHCRGHVPFASLPGMWDRTITISSAGKTFSATGWQVGWCVGPQRLISRIHQLLPYVQFCASTVIQEALARSLPIADEEYEGHPSYYDYLRDKYTRKRDLLVNALTKAGFAVPDYERTTGGGFFIFARIGKEIQQQIPSERLNAPNPAAPGGIARQDWALCQWMAEEKGILCIPASPFFSKEQAESGAADGFIRVAFCKSDETIEAAAVALLKVRGDSSKLSKESVTLEENITQR
jgi:kynurenine--oxoglutarate transaminase/cysteine-S-conjugate beta-lyase/glutamine--phenylpyruvate transaminase